MIEIQAGLGIPDDELELVTSRSGGPGGQNVNKLETRVTVRFDVARSPSLSQAQRERLAERLATRISRGGILQVTSQRHRTQAANREAALGRFVELLREALLAEEPRVRTRVPRRVRERRLAAKRGRSRRKRDRSAPPSEEG